MKKRPTVEGLEAAANYFANLLPDFNRLSLEEQERARTSLRITASYVQALRTELADACPACGSVVGEGVWH